MTHHPIRPGLADPLDFLGVDALLDDDDFTKMSGLHHRHRRVIIFKIIISSNNINHL